MESQTAFWFLAVLAQVVGTIQGFLIVAFIFWLSKPSYSREWRERLGWLTMLIFIFGMTIVFFAVITILDISGSTVVGSWAPGMISVLKYSFLVYLIAVASLVGLILWVGAVWTAEEEYQDIG